MSETRFQFKHFTIDQEKAAMKVGVDSVLLGAVAGFNSPESILDIGAGTGLLSFMAEQRTGARVVAVEIGLNAYKQCAENIILNNKAANIKVIHSSIQDFSTQCKLKYHHIISNPPFFNNSFKSKNNTRNLARHTEKLSFKELISAVSILLSDKGIFSVIIPFEEQETFMQFTISEKLFCFRKIIIFPKESKEPHRLILEFSKIYKTMIVEKIVIRSKDTNRYTERYKELTKDFYLDKKNL